MSASTAVMAKRGGIAQGSQRFGAAHYLASREEGAPAAAAGSFDLILSTVSADLPWADYLAMLRPAGTLSVVGVPPGGITAGAMALLPAAKSISGGVPGSIDHTRAMPSFAARHDIRPVMETFPIAESAAALDQVRAGPARYRAVLEF